MKSRVSCTSACEPYWRKGGYKGKLYSGFMEFGADEKNCLRFYQGAIDSYEISTELERIKYTSSFYKTNKAYELLNMLLYPGMNNEYARICEEEREVPFSLLQNMEEILQVYENIFTLMCKSSIMHGEEKYYLYRKDRMQSMEMVDAGYTFGFTSCSLEDSQDRYFLEKKDGILLLELELSGNIPHTDMNELLGKTEFFSQKEILLPPFVCFHKEAIPFTERELSYEDRKHEPPKAKYLLKVYDIHIGAEENIGNIENIENILAGADMAEAVLRNLEAHKAISQQEQDIYCRWKEKLQSQVRLRFAEIYHKNRG